MRRVSVAMRGVPALIAAGATVAAVGARRREWRVVERLDEALARIDELEGALDVSIAHSRDLEVRLVTVNVESAVRPDGPSEPGHAGVGGGSDPTVGAPRLGRA